MREEVAQQEAELEALKNAEALKDEWERKARECAEEVCVCTHKRYVWVQEKRCVYRDEWERKARECAEYVFIYTLW